MNVMATGRTGLKMTGVDLREPALKTQYEQLTARLNQLLVGGEVTDLGIKRHQWPNDQLISGCVEFDTSVNTMIRTMPALIKEFPALRLEIEITCRNDFSAWHRD